MATMRTALEHPHALSEFWTPGIGVKNILRNFGRSRDFSGCYVLLQEEKAFYVGISHGVVGRLRQHGTGRTHFDASLAYRMACEKAAHEMTRAEAMKDLPQHRFWLANARAAVATSQSCGIRFHSRLGAKAQPA